jgi:hypothetical protein
MVSFIFAKLVEESSAELRLEQDVVRPKLALLVRGAGAREEIGQLRRRRAPTGACRA